MKPIPDCPRCGGQKYTNMPDSLAWFCHGCGYVWVLTPSDPRGWEPGVDIQTWLDDVYGKKEKA